MSTSRAACRASTLLASVALTAALAVTLSACGKAGGQASAAPSDPASSSAPVKWDYASNDPAKNPTAANKEASTPGFNP